MTKNEKRAFRHFIKAYKHQYDLNSYARSNYDEDLEFYTGYRPQNRYPLPYSESFNKLLPKIQTILSKFMEQMYQGGTDDLTSVRPRKKSDVERAPRVRGLLNYQMETLNNIDCHGGSYLFNMQWMFNALTYGKGIAKMYWRKEERIAPRRIDIPIPQFDNAGNPVGMEYVSRIVEEPQIVYDGPYAEVLHNKLFVPHPHYKSIQKMPFVFCVYPKSLDYIREMEKKGVYKNIKDIGWASNPNVPHTSSPSSSMEGDSSEAFAKSLEIEGALQASAFESQDSTPEIDIIEGYGKYIWPGDDVPYDVGSGIKVKGAESETIIHIGNYKTVLKIEKNKYGQRPFFDIGCYYHPEMYWDIGLIRLGKGIQEQYDTLANTRMSNAMMLVNQMLKVREDADIPPESLIWKPYGIIPVEEMDDVQALVTPDVSQSQVFKEQEQFFSSTLDDMLGMYAYNQGKTPERQEHVGTMYSLQSMGEARTKLLMMTMDHTGFRPLLQYMMLLNVWHLDNKTEARINTPEGPSFTKLFSGDIHNDYDFSARYTATEPALGKHFRSQQLIQYAQMWQGSPYLQHHQFMKAVLELMDFHDTDKFLKSPQQVQQETQQQQQQMMQGAAMQTQQELQVKNAENQGKAFQELIKGLMK